MRETVQQTALVHHLDAAHVQSHRADDLGRFRVPFQYDHVHAVTPDSPETGCGRGILRHEPGLAARPPVRYMLK
ncbi:hypothetical protein AOZ06_03715 [Kibdelosporangium phytohabitans]|uniref:Uncharacterized protein n=1 Tax=Kibdelosporangium phytohabitans TaxID=860235 RepID=A0A0N9HNW0_9PSEU|nr:hypothetical protein AOZ06_03715 [Kibdelosporangium phytohabitans]